MPTSRLPATVLSDFFAAGKTAATEAWLVTGCWHRDRECKCEEHTEGKAMRVQELQPNATSVASEESCDPHKVGSFSLRA